ncbi:hypothetical protein U1Q18_024465, partial [Sarracenia purpurea var. burkii]
NPPIEVPRRSKSSIHLKSGPTEAASRDKSAPVRKLEFRPKVSGGREKRRLSIGNPRFNVRWLLLWPLLLLLVGVVRRSDLIGRDGIGGIKSDEESPSSVAPCSSNLRLEERRSRRGCMEPIE